uniref:Uncharacterized protein n=1 Tax=Panagrolaimus superbus TaxID=310955 RepID=A0A914YA27_9BILA
MATSDSSNFEQSSINLDGETAEAAIDKAISSFYSNETYNSAMKCTFRRSETNPDKFNVIVDIKQINQNQKRHLVLENCFEHCNCLQQLVELRRQKQQSNAFHQISMQYGGEASFQPSNLSKHVKHVRSRKSSGSLFPSTLSTKKSSKTSKKKSNKK